MQESNKIRRLFIMLKTAHYVTLLTSFIIPYEFIKLRRSTVVLFALTNREINIYSVIFAQALLLWTGLFLLCQQSKATSRTLRRFRSTSQFLFLTFFFFHTIPWDLAKHAQPQTQTQSAHTCRWLKANHLPVAVNNRLMFLIMNETWNQNWQVATETWPFVWKMKNAVGNA